MKLDIEVTLDSGGTVSIRGENLTAEDVFETFGLLSGYTVTTTAQDEPPEES